MAVESKPHFGKRRAGVSSRSRGLLDAHGPAALLALLSALAAAAAVHAGRGLTFFFDEWNFILERRGISFETFLEPHGGDHPAVVPVAAYKLMLQVFGLGNYAPYRLLVIAVHLTCAVLLYVYARRRIGRWLALAPAALLLFLGSAWQDILWPFQIGFLGSLAAGLGMLLLLDGARTRDGLACLLLTLSLMSSSLGLIFVVVAALELAPDRARLRRAWVVVVPLAILAVIYLGFGGDGPERQLASPGNAVRYALDMAAAAAGGLGGLGLDWGRPLLLAGVALVAALLWQLPAPPLRIVALAGGALMFWLLTGVSRAEWKPDVPPDTSRYIYPSALLLLLILVTALAGRQRVSRAGGALLGLAVAFACVSGAGVLGDGGGGLRTVSAALLPELTALEAARERADPNLLIDPERSPGLVAGRYFDAIDSFGSPAASLEAVRRDPAALPIFDAALARAQGLALQPAPASAPREGRGPTIEGTAAGTVEIDGTCREFRPQGTGAALDLALPPGAVTLTATDGPPVELRLRRLSDAWPATASTLLGPGETGRLEVPADRLPGQWHLRLSPRQDVRVCSAP
jgi:hypothetical protein